MPSFDVVNKVDLQTLDNAINNAQKEITTRFDFKSSKTSIEFDKKNYSLKITTEDSMRMGHIEDILRSKFSKQNIHPKCLDFGEPEAASGNMIRKDVKVQNGIEKEMAKKIVKLIKDSNTKVQAAIMDDIVRVTGKKIDDLQEVIAVLKGADLDIPLQFVNMKS